MSGSINSVFLIGNLGADPEIKFNAANGQDVCNFRIATSETWKDKQGQKQERTEWHRITVWGGQAKPCAEYLKKGSSVCVEGRIQSHEYEKDGQKHRSFEIRARHVEFLGGKAKAETQSNDESAPF